MLYSDLETIGRIEFSVGLKKQKILNDKEKAFNYAEGLVKDVFKIMNWLQGFKGSVSRFQPMTWETNPDLAEIIELYSDTFKNFSENQKKLATYYYIEQLAEQKVKGLKVSLIDKMESFAPTARNKGISLLDAEVVSEYFGKFNKNLKSKSMKNQAEETASIDETKRGCRIE